MKSRYVLIAFSLSLICGCSRPSPPPGTGTDLSGLPRFRLVQVISGQLIQIGPNDEVVTSQVTGPYHSYTTRIPALGPSRGENWLESHPNESKLQVHQGDKTSFMDRNMFLDDLGIVQPFLTQDNIVETVGGRRIALQPIAIPSTKYRYYSGSHGIYVSSRLTGKLEQIYDHEVKDSVSGRSDVLFATTATKDGLTEIIRFGTAIRPKSIYKGVDCKVLNIGQDGSVIAVDGNQFVRISSEGIIQKIPNAKYDVCNLKFRDKNWLVGFRVVTSSDKKTINSHPAIWNDRGETIALIKLCPELEGRITRLENMHQAKVMSNSNGLIAIEMSGSNPNPEYKVGGPNPGNMMDRIYSWQTYVLKAIDQP